MLALLLLHDTVLDPELETKSQMFKGQSPTTEL